MKPSLRNRFLEPRTALAERPRSRKHCKYHPKCGRGAENIANSSQNKPQKQKTLQITTKIAQFVAEWMRAHRPDKVFIDTGEGWGVIDQLHGMGFPKNLVEGVHFNSKASDTTVYANKRAEIWCRLRDHIQGEDGPVSLPDSDDIQKDLMSMPEPDGATGSGKIRMIAKAKVRKDLGCSPDIGDGYGLTHTSYVFSNSSNQALYGTIRKKTDSVSSLKTVQRRHKASKPSLVKTHRGRKKR